MRQAWLALLIIVLIPVYLIALFVIHELGHTLLARLLGDPISTFYLFKIDEGSRCMGCTYYDWPKLSWGANLMVSLAGLATSQTVALIALFLLGLRRGNRSVQHVLSAIALSFALFDVPWQVLQALIYNLDRSRWPTGVDLMDFLLLLQMKSDINPFLLKGFVLLVGVAYLSTFLWFYRRNSAVQQPATEAA